MAVRIIAGEPVWGWIREEVTADTCLGTAAVRAHAGAFFRGLTDRTEEVETRSRSTLQGEALALAGM